MSGPTPGPVAIHLTYDRQTGAIHKQIIGQLNPYDWDETTQASIELMDALTYDTMATNKVDLDTLAIVPKTPIPYNIGGVAIANSSSVLSVEDLPDGTIYEDEVVEDNFLEFTFDAPGPFVIELTNPLYSPTTIEIDVLEP